MTCAVVKDTLLVILKRLVTFATVPGAMYTPQEEEEGKEKYIVLK